MIPLRLLTLLNFLNTSSQRGILIKDGQALDRLKTIDTLVFDKTGTLTQDLPHIVQIHSVQGHQPDAVLALAAAAEQRQTHPIARAILAESQARQFELPVFDEGNYRIGYGIEVRIDGRRVRVGSLRYMRMEGITVPEDQQALARDCQALAHSLVFVAVDEALWGAIELKATLRPAAKAVIGWLKAQGYALHILSGDQEAPTRQLAEELGMSGYFANTLPEQKAEMIADLQRQGRKVCFIGDGINDSVALRQADVSISLRGASTVATDAAQIVLMDDDLAQLRTLFELSTGFHKNVRTNFKLAVAASLTAVAGVLAWPLYKFWVVEIMATSHFLTGVGVASRPLLTVEEQSADDAPAKRH
jgi:Cu2+-exporting ATPase